MQWTSNQLQYWLRNRRCAVCDFWRVDSTNNLTRRTSITKLFCEWQRKRVNSPKTFKLAFPPFWKNKRWGQKTRTEIGKIETRNHLLHKKWHTWNRFLPVSCYDTLNWRGGSSSSPNHNSMLHHNSKNTPTSTHHHQSCPSNTLSRTKLSARSPTSFVTMAMTGMNSATMLPARLPRRKPLNLRRHHAVRSCVTRPPKPQANLLPSHSYKWIPIVLSSSTSNTMTSGGSKLLYGPLKKLTLQPMLRIGIDSRWQNNTSFYMFSPSSRPLTASSTRISVATLQPKSHHRKPDASTASRSPPKTSTARRTRSSSTLTSRTPRRRHIFYEQSIPSPVSNGKHCGRSNGATPLQPALPNAWSHLLQ